MPLAAKPHDLIYQYTTNASPSTYMYMSMVDSGKGAHMMTVTSIDGRCVQGDSCCSYLSVCGYRPSTVDLKLAKVVWLRLATTLTLAQLVQPTTILVQAFL